MTGFAKATYFNGENTLKVGQGTFKTSVRRGKQFKGYSDFFWDFNFAAQYDGPSEVESIVSECYVIEQVKSMTNPDDYKVSVRSLKIKTNENDSNKNRIEKSLFFMSERGDYVQGTIKAVVVSTLKLRGKSELYRLTAETKSKKQYDYRLPGN